MKLLNGLRKEIKAVWAIARGDLIATFRNFSSVFFGILFPLVFISIFGFLGEGTYTYKIAFDPNSNTDNVIYDTLSEIDSFEIIEESDQDALDKMLEEADVLLIIDIQTVQRGTFPGYDILMTQTNADFENSSVALSIVQGVLDNINLTFAKQVANTDTLPVMSEVESVEGRKFTQIDFVLPGQLGFGLLNMGVMGTAFLFISLRETLVLKRFFATPISKRTIIVGEAISKLTFSIIQSSVLILAGVFFFDFTLINGVSTFFALLALAAFGMTIFLGLGFIVSSLAKDQNSVSPIANLVTIPQFLLAGTFFPIEYFPEWLQPISKILPLTYLNDAMRKVSFYGAGLEAIQRELIILFVMFVVIYVVAVKTFRWKE